MPSLILSNNSASNPQTLDVSSYLRLQPDQGADPADPAFSEKVWGRSILREGATLALEQVTEKELLFPLALKGTTSSVVSGTLVQQINQIITTAGATASWQDDGMSQPTVFDLLSGQVDIEYSYFRGKQAWCNCKLRLFAQPYGHPAAPRPYAAASGVGPLLVISPYASGGGQVIGASTQAGVAGYGGVKQGGVPSGGVFYWGSPSLAGDAPAMLQISYVGPLPNQATNAGTVPYVAMSVLPDALYQPLTPASQIALLPGSMRTSSTAVASSYLSAQLGPNSNYQETALSTYYRPANVASEPTIAWAGFHRLFAIARASSTPGATQAAAFIQVQGGPLVPNPTTATYNPTTDWQLIDLGTYSLRASQSPIAPINIAVGAGAGPSSAIANDVTALISLPDSSTWFFPAKGISPSQYGYPPGIAAISPNVPTAPYTNTLLIDDVSTDQFLYAGASATFAPSPIGSVASAGRITQFTRGLIPRPDPKNGLPILAILGVAQPNTPSTAGALIFPTNTWSFAGASWANPQNLPAFAQVNVLERTRFELP